MYGVYSILNKNALICAYSELCKEAYGQLLDAVSEKVPQYQHDERVWKCPLSKKVSNSVRRSSGGVGDTQNGK